MKSDKALSAAVKNLESDSEVSVTSKYDHAVFLDHAGKPSFTALKDP